MNIQNLYNRLVKRARAESYGRNTAPVGKPRNGFYMSEPESVNPIQEHLRKMFPKQHIANTKDSKPKYDNNPRPQLLPYYPNRDQSRSQLLPYYPNRDQSRLQLF